jgi:hypothetical protein
VGGQKAGVGGRRPLVSLGEIFHRQLRRGGESVGRELPDPFSWLTCVKRRVRRRHPVADGTPLGY